MPIARPGARTPLDFLLCVMEDPTVDATLRVKAAAAAAPYVHAKKENGKKAEAAEKAKKAAATGARFAPPRPPKLVVSND